MLKTTDGTELNIEELSWDETHPLINKVLPNLSKMLESYDNDDFKFYLAKYTFGAKIFHSGKCYLPTLAGSVIEMNNQSLPEELARNLNYDVTSEDPLCIILSKQSELYLETGSRIMSHAIVNPGYTFGIPRSIEPEGFNEHSRSSLAWNLNAGSRSIFFLTKISSKIKHEKLCKTLKLRIQPPESVEDEWIVFNDVIKALNPNWHMEVLFFSRDFVKQIKKMESFQLANYLMMMHRATYNVWHNTSLIWNAVFSEIEQKKYLSSYSMYSIFTARQLFLIAANSAVGFKPTLSDEAAPFSEIKKAYNEYYGFAEDKQSDIMMLPSNLDLKIEDSVYYSVNNPMLAEYTPDTFKGKSLISLLEEVMYIVNTYQKAILSDHASIESLYKVANSTIFSFYHGSNSDDNYKNVLSVQTLIAEDKRFLETSNGIFPETSGFFKGCVKITRKPSEQV